MLRSKRNILVRRQASKLKKGTGREGEKNRGQGRDYAIDIALNWVMIYRIFGASPERWRVCPIEYRAAVRLQIKGILLLQITGLHARTMRQRVETKPRSR